MTTGIVTVTFNSAGVLGEFIESLVGQTHGQFRLYAVDNASEDDSVQLLTREKRIDVKLIRNSANLGFAQSTNIGIRQALADHCVEVLLLNNDTVLSPLLLERLLQAASRHPIVAPKIYLHGKDVLWFAGARISPWRGFDMIHEGEGEIDRGQYDVSKEIDAATACCLMVRDSVFDRIGVLDRAYFAYYEDLDFSLRARRAGIPIWYAADAFLYHKAGALTGGAASDFGALMGARNRVYYLKKNYGIAACSLFTSMYLGYLTARCALGEDSWGRFRVRLKGVLEGVRLPIRFEADLKSDADEAAERNPTRLLSGRGGSH